MQEQEQEPIESVMADWSAVAANYKVFLEANTYVREQMDTIINISQTIYSESKNKAIAARRTRNADKRKREAETK